MAKFRCIRKNFGFMNRFHAVGDIVDVSEANLKHPSLQFFERYDPSKPKAEAVHRGPRLTERKASVAEEKYNAKVLSPVEKK